MTETTAPHEFTPGTDHPRWCAICGSSPDAYAHASAEERAWFDAGMQGPNPAQPVPVIDVGPQPAPAVAAADDKRRRRIIIAVAAVLVLAGGGTGLAIALTSGSSSSSKGGFYNMTTLEQSVQSQLNTDPNMPIGATVDSCSMVSGNTAECIIGSGIDGNTQGITVLISADGQSWTQQ